MTFYSTLSKETIFSRMQAHTQKATWPASAGKLSLWRRGGYFELTWPTGHTLTSFCGWVREKEGRRAITGFFLPGHDSRVGLLVLFLVSIPLCWYVTGSVLPVFLLTGVFLAVPIICLAAGADTGRTGHDKVIDFICTHLLS